ncbi:hypothetical protein ACJMK2_000124 [Sinanodonta woodiana]|uniref:Roc domain-containing protein n=1 Tax=Sinanodonta woodiana TaxID=1069815 RepID=A0ABD3XQ61_SINWO
MASGGQQKIGQDLVNVGKLILKPDDLDPRGVVVFGDKLVITEWKSDKVRVYRRHDGMSLSSIYCLGSTPYGVCCVNDTDLCVAMIHGIIAIMSVQDSGHISRGKTFDLRPLFDECHGVSLWNDNIVISGVKDKTIYWCVVSLNDGRPDKLIKVCRGDYYSFLTVKRNMVYITCHSYSNNDSGVYGFNLLNSSQPKYTYKHNELTWPRGITVNDIGHLFVCDNWFSSIYLLSWKCQLVAIYKNDIIRNPFAMFWDSGCLYLTSDNSNTITMYKTPQHDPILPMEILSMESNSIQLYQKAMDAGMEKVYNIRLMVVGQFGVGKTTLIKRLLGQPVDISERKSTEGIDVHKHCCKISLDTGEWIQQHKDSDQLYTLHRLNKLLSVPDQKKDISEEQDDIVEVIYQREIVETIYEIDATKSSTQLAITRGDEIHHVEHLDKETGIVVDPLSDVKSSVKMKDAMIEILRLVNENADKLVKDIEKYAALSIWDFAGQYTFYTTHQAFLTSRAIYLLVIDLSQQITDFIQDDKCFLDAEGIKLHKVFDLIQIWMNSIHSSVLSPDAIVPVILVGTHVDKFSEKFRKEAIDKYFIELRYMFGEKPTIRHLVDDIAIDNTQPDPMLEELKKIIFEVSKQQPHWGEERPARWLPLEQAIMTLKASGTKIVELSLIEEINMSGSVKIEDRDELELFLNFHHELGTILYFR